LTWAPLKRFCDGASQYGLNVPASEYREDGIRFLRTSDLRPDGSVAEDGAVYVDGSTVAPEYELADGDLLFSRSGTLGRCLRYRTSMGEATFAGYLVRFRPSADADPDYLSWCAQGRFFGEAIEADAITSTISNFNAERYAGLLIPAWNLAEQRTIADFLDAETARIDALITKKRRLIELLGERRMSVMTDGVAGSLTSKAPRRRSTLTWLEAIPDHWGEVGLTLVARLGSGHTPSRSRSDWWIESERTIPWITTGEVARLRSDRVEYVRETRELISPLGLANSAAEIHPADTVVLCRTASAGYSGIMGSEMATSQDFATWTCGPLLRPRFLLLCLRAMRRDLLGRLAMGSTHKTIYMPDIQALRIPLPPVEEQDPIVAEAWSAMNSGNAAQDLLTRQLALLAEHRQALITAAVTGELDVAREIAEEAS